jgi:phosphoenolpyruvate carboxykinase (GTP)
VQVGALRRDPMAMLPFCGYNMGDYFAHWLKLGANADALKLPQHLLSSTGSARTRTAAFLWPGYGENSRVLKWVVERVQGTATAIDTPIGRLPAPGRST